MLELRTSELFYPLLVVSIQCHKLFYCLWTLAESLLQILLNSANHSDIPEVMINSLSYTTRILQSFNLTYYIYFNFFTLKCL